MLFCILLLNNCGSEFMFFTSEDLTIQSIEKTQSCNIDQFGLKYDKKN